MRLVRLTEELEMKEIKKKQRKTITRYLSGGLIGAIFMAAVFYLSALPFYSLQTHVGKLSISKIDITQLTVRAEKISSLIDLNSGTIISATINEGPASIAVKHTDGTTQDHDLPVGTKLIYRWSDDGSILSVSILYP